MSPNPQRSREEVARQEIGHTHSTPVINLVLTVIFLVTIGGVPMLQFVGEMAQIRTGAMPGRRLPQSLDLITRLLPAWVDATRHAIPDTGRLAVARHFNERIRSDINLYEAELRERDRLRQWLVPRLQVPVTGWLRGGTENAYCGREGWLFYRRDVESLTGPGFLEPDVLARRRDRGERFEAVPEPDPLPAIVDFRDQLAQRGVELLLLPVPVKPSIQPDRYSPRCSPGQAPIQNPSWERFLESLTARGIECLDPAPLLARTNNPTEPLYLRSDTHWTPRGMELVAAGLAQVIRAAVSLPPPQDRFSTVERTITNRGDVAMLLGLPEWHQLVAPETVTVQQVRDGTTAWRPDPGAEVLLLGDSFANIYSVSSLGWGEGGGLAEHLSVALGLPVDSITRNDGGSHATRELLAKELAQELSIQQVRAGDRLAGKKMVIWQFAARELASGDWRLVELPQVAQTGFRRPQTTRPQPSRYVPSPGRVVTVRGVVRAVAPVPQPGSVPYKDHLRSVLLAELTSSDDPAASGREAVVFVRSMRDNKWTAAATWRPGDTVSLRLRPWSEVVDQLAAINRSELDDDDLLLVEPAWGE